MLNAMFPAVAAAADPRQEVYFTLVLIVIGTFIGAIILRSVAQTFIEVEITLGRAFIIAFLTIAASAIIRFINVFFMFGPPKSQGEILTNNIIILLICVLITGRIYGAMVRDPASRRPIGFGKGMKVAFIVLFADIALRVVGIGFLTRLI